MSRKNFKLGVEKVKAKYVIQSMRFDKNFIDQYKEVKKILKKKNLVHKVIKYKEDDNFIYFKFYNSNEFKKKSFINFISADGTKIIKGILK